MTIFEMLQQSAILTLVGMIVVFTFLWFMTICISLVGKIIGSGKLEEAIVPPQKAMPQTTSDTVNPEIVAAITVAVRDYQKAGNDL